MSSAINTTLSLIDNESGLRIVTSSILLVREFRRLSTTKSGTSKDFANEAANSFPPASTELNSQSFFTTLW